jgi:hypothetical protein
MVSAYTELRNVGTITATSRLLSEASVPAARFGT